MSYEQNTAIETDLLAILLGPAPVQQSTPAPKPKPAPRHFYRCTLCLSVACTEKKISTYVDEAGWTRHGKCGACDGNLEYLGETKGDHLTQVQYLCPCDSRCTNAPGPNCDCRCGGENHGTGRLVAVEVDAGGVPRLKVTPEARKVADEFIALRDTVWDAYDAKYGDVNEMKAAGEWIGNWSFYMDGQYTAKRIRAACAMRSNARNKKLSAILNELKGVK